MMRGSALCLCAALFVAACSSNSPERLDAARPDVSSADATTDVTDASPPSDTLVEDATDGAVDAPSTDASDASGCFVGMPHTRLEFLNRCTDAETTEKVVTLPLARPDGTLPPLP